MEQGCKYQRHGQAQTRRILDAAQRLFIENGIDAVTLSQVAAACGITRATLYKYFSSKERLLWEIHHLHMARYGEELKELLGGRQRTTYQRFSAYFDLLYARFCTDMDSFLFLRVFDSIYQQETVPGGQGMYRKVFHPSDFGSGDTVRLLAANFHDGSVLAGLDPIPTCAALVYSSLSLLSGFAQDARYLPAKYGVEARLLARAALDALLRGIAPRQESPVPGD